MYKKLGIITTFSFVSLLSFTALADENSAELLKQMKAMQQQINALQKEVKTLKAQQTKTATVTAKLAKRTTSQTANTDAATAAALAPAAGNQSGTADSGKTKVADAVLSTAPSTTLQNKGIKLTLGGYLEAAGIERSRSESADIGSSWVGIPLPISSGNHISEFRESARQSRLSLLAEGSPDKDTNLAAYFEADFLGAAPTANSNESNSYNPRLRQAYATADWNDIGLHLLGGQAWSLITLNKNGINPRQENVPLTIEAQYVPGFTWTRNPQLRLSQDFDDKKLWAGLSFESPQAIVFNGPNNPPSGAPIVNLGGGSGFSSTNSYSTDLAPDIIAKLVADPGYGHYELSGITRFFRDRNHVGGSDKLATGYGIGIAAILPIIEKKLDFQISGLAGRGIGRYGSVQLPDITTKADGSIATIAGFEALAGFTAHPDEKWDLYLYSGIEQVARQYSNNGAGTTHAFGYGNPFYDNSGCDTEGAAAATCVGNTRAVAQLTGGAWWKFYKGGFGMMEAGVQDSYSKRFVYSGSGGSPSADENITMISFRYYPF